MQLINKRHNAHQLYSRSLQPPSFCACVGMLWGNTFTFHFTGS